MITSTMMNPIRFKFIIFMLCLVNPFSIINRCGNAGLFVLPVFYKVDPSDVRHQRGRYGDALTKQHERRFPENKLQKCKEALPKVAHLSDYHFKDRDGYEYKFIGNIVDCVSQKLNHPARLHVGDYLVGLESRVKKVMMLLDVGSDDVLMVGIHGMGGIGKSTLARAVYNNLIAEKFDGSCYLGNVREKSEKHGLEYIQRILLQEILRDEKINVTSVERGVSMIAERLQRKKVLLVLDDIDNLKQLEAIVGSPEWFGLGSRVIITTRDRKPLACHQVKRIYEVETLNYNDARQLLTWKAFKKEKADPTYEKVLNSVITNASGLPLALEVIGCHLSGMPMEEWKSAIEYYKRNSHEGIQGILEVSLRPLQKDLKNVFLDIACCFNGYELREVVDILGACYDLDMEYAIKVLVDKSLVMLSRSMKPCYDTVTLHHFLEEMGKAIFSKKSPRDPSKRSRLWLPEDIIPVLEKKSGTDRIEIICLEFPISDKEVTVEWDGNAFRNMQNLRILIIRNCNFSKGPAYLPNSLRVLEWWRYPSHCLPSDFHPEKLTICKLPCSRISKIELIGLLQKFPTLRVLKFSSPNEDT